MKELISIQNELKSPKNQYNSFGKYKYRSCEDILEAVKPLLKKHNCILTMSDEIKIVGDLVYVEASGTLCNEKDKCFTVKAQAGINPNRKGMDIAQSFGASSSYARKYALNGLFLIDDTKDADHFKPEPTKTETYKKPVNDKITDEQRVRFHTIRNACKVSEQAAKTMLKAYGFSSTSDITYQKYDEVCKQLKEMGELTEEKGTNEA